MVLNTCAECHQSAAALPGPGHRSQTPSHRELGSPPLEHSTHPHRRCPSACREALCPHRTEGQLPRRFGSLHLPALQEVWLVRLLVLVSRRLLHTLPTHSTRGEIKKHKLRIETHNKLLISPEAWQTQQLQCVVERLLQLPPRASQSRRATHTHRRAGVQAWALGSPVPSDAHTDSQRSLHKSVLHLSQDTTNNEERVVMCCEALPQHNVLMPHGCSAPLPDFGRENFECSCLPSTFILNLRDS